MTHKDTTLSNLVRYFQAYMQGELNNEPARLLCEYVESNFDLDDESNIKEIFSDWLDRSDFNNLGLSGELGGITVTQGIEECFVEYGQGEHYSWLSLGVLLELAEIAETTGNSAPLPDWYEPEWMGITQGLAERLIQEMDCAEATSILEEYIAQVYCRDDPYWEDAPVERNFDSWFEDPKKTLEELVEDRSPEERAKLLNQY
jgi:hypothetical protein